MRKDNFLLFGFILSIFLISFVHGADTSGWINSTTYQSCSNGTCTIYSNITYHSQALDTKDTSFFEKGLEEAQKTGKSTLPLYLRYYAGTAAEIVLYLLTLYLVYLLIRYLWKGFNEYLKKK